MSNTNDCLIRKATKEDIDIIAWTVLTALDLDASNISKEQRDLIALQDGLYHWDNALICEMNGISVACIISYNGAIYKKARAISFKYLTEHFNLDLQEQADETNEGEYYIDSIAIKEDYRKKGLGKLLISYAIALGKQNHLSTCSLLVSEAKPRLFEYYKSLNFKEVGRLSCFGEEFIRMNHIANSD